MKKGLLALILLALVAAIPACKQRDCNDKKSCNPCSWLKCRKKCDDGEVKERKPKREKKKKCDPCGWLKCKKKSNKDEMNDEDMAPRRERMMREDMAPAARRMQ